MRVTIDGHFQRPYRWYRTAADLGDSAEDGRIEVACSALVAHADRHVFENHKAAFVPYRFAIHAALLHRAITVFAFEIIHGMFPLGKHRFRKADRLQPRKMHAGALLLFGGNHLFLGPAIPANESRDEPADGHHEWH